MPLFRITYTDPTTEERKTIEQEYEDTPATHEHAAISAREWAEDLAYTLADKRMDYEIKEIKPNASR